MSGTVLLFAGQGAQQVGMGRGFVEQSAACRDMAGQAREALGFDVLDICLNGPEERLTRSDVAQPAIFLVSAMCLQAWKEKHGTVAAALACAGLSLGEWTALHAAGTLTLGDTLRILGARGRFMQEACDQTPGGMISLMGLSPEQAAVVAERSGLEVANINSPVQVVLSGHRDRLAAAEQIARELGAKRALPLNVAGAFHSSLMQPAADRLADFIRDIPFSRPAVPVIANVTARPHADDPEAIRAAMVRQVTGSVRWVESMEWARDQGADRYVEFGPGKVLTGLVKRIDPAAGLVNIQAVEDAAG